MKDFPPTSYHQSGEKAGRVPLIDSESEAKSNENDGGDIECVPLEEDRMEFPSLNLDPALQGGRLVLCLDANEKVHYVLKWLEMDFILL